MSRWRVDDVVDAIARLIETSPAASKETPVKTPKQTAKPTPPPRKPPPKVRKPSPKPRARIEAVGTPRPAPLSPTQLIESLRAQPVPVPVHDAHETTDPTPCRVCGGPVEVDGCLWRDRWRQHKECLVEVEARPVAVRLAVVAPALGIGVVDWDTAIRAQTHVPLYADLHAEPVYVGKPSSAWEHLDRKRIVKALAEVAAENTPGPCSDGPCAFCGVVDGLGWASHGHQWADGSPAPLCGPCAAVYVRRGSPSPTWWDDQRAALSEALTGVPVPLGEYVPDGIVGYAETATSEPNNGGNHEDTTGPWGHLDPAAVDAYRWEQWGRFSAHAPPEHRAEAVARATAKAEAKAAKTAAFLAEQAARLDTFGFGT